jgi:hypothetical protein
VKYCKLAHPDVDDNLVVILDPSKVSPLIRDADALCRGMKGFCGVVFDTNAVRVVPLGEAYEHLGDKDDKDYETLSDADFYHWFDAPVWDIKGAIQLDSCEIRTYTDGFTVQFVARETDAVYETRTMSWEDL